ncbi:MAG: glycosyl hydrolase family 28 protein [Verrucomicrobiia bacterium]
MWIAGLLLASAELTLADPVLPSIPATIFNVNSFGAVGDGTTDNTTAIQDAIDAASGAAGGIVEIPAGTYLSGPLTLASKINLQIDAGATLKALPVNTFTNYPAQSQPYPNLIYASDMTDLEISGSGTIDGQGQAWWSAPTSGNLYKNRSYLIYFNGGCQRVWIHGVTVQNPPKMHFVFKGVDNDITFENITINTPASPNTDGIDLVGTHCLVRNCTINAGDDNIALGSSSPSAVSTDILITNCTFGIGHGVSIGSNTAGGVSNLTVTACTFDGTEYGIRMKSSNATSGGSGQGGVAQNLFYSNITMTNIIHGAIVIYSYYGSGGIYGTPTTVTPFGASTQSVGSVLFPIWRNITISNVTASVGSSGVPGILWGRSEMLISNVTLSQVRITGTRPFDIYNAQGIQIIDSQITVPGTTNTFNLYNADVTVTNSVAGGNPIMLGGLATSQTTNTLALFNMLAEITDTNMLGAAPITLGGSTIFFTQPSVSFSNDLNILDFDGLVFFDSTNSFSGALTNSGELEIELPGSMLTLLGDSSAFNGVILVDAGTLRVDNTAGSGTGTAPITVTPTGTLGGTGVIGGPVTVDGTLAPGNSPGTLTISNNLVVNSDGTLQYELGTSSDLTMVSGNLTLGGTLNIADAGGFTTNTYTLFTYGGTLTTNGSPGILTIGTTPDPTLAYVVDTNTVGLVKLVVFIPPPVAGFNATPTAGIAPVAVTFSDTSTGRITNRHWDFGDGATLDTLATNVVHDYNGAGTWTVQLIVSGPGGAGTNTQVNDIFVAPPCNFTLSATNASFGVTGGGGASVTVTTYTNACTWTASSTASWIQIAGGGVSTGGTAIVTYSVLPNISSSIPRTGTMTIAGQTFTVTEAGDPIAPTVALTAPTSGNTSNTITLSAAAADNVAVVKVEFYRDNGVLLGSVGTAPYSMNFDTTTVADGPHCFYAKAYDAANNVGSSSTNCVIVDNNAPTVPTGLTATGVATNQINLSWNASSDSGTGVAGYKVFRDETQIATTAGTNYSDAGLATGTEHCYKVVAYDNIARASGQSAEVCAQSLDTVNMLLGSYNGLVEQTNAPSHASSGTIKFAVGKAGSFAASVALGGAKGVAFRGQFDAAGNWTNTVPRRGQASLQVILHLDLSGTDQITGTVSDGTFTSELLADRAAYSHKNPCPFAGTFTAVLQPPEGDNPNIPQGFGYGTLAVTTAGQGRMTGVLSDGTKTSVKVPLSKQGTWPLYQALYKNGGASIGWVTISTSNTVDATVDWFRPSMPTSVYFPAGFTTNVTLHGQEYVKPVDITPSSAGINGLVTLGGGNLESSIVKTVFVYATGKVTVLSPNSENVQMNFQPTTGQFSGSFTHPALNTTIGFTGLALQFRGDAAGYFLGASESGFVTFEPTPTP